MNKRTLIIVSLVVTLLFAVLMIFIFNKTNEVTPAPISQNPVVVTPGIPLDTPTTTPVQSEKILPYGDFTLQVKEIAKFKNISITLVAITEDSRCAAGVTCVWAGTLKAKLQVSSVSGTSSQIIELGKQLAVGSEILKLHTAVPYPKSGKTITEDEYRLTFSIQKKTDNVKPVTPPNATSTKPLACYVGGCSGQICSDTQGMVSTCIYKEEYACYKSATCERQSNGACGWTNTKELEMCIASAK